MNLICTLFALASALGVILLFGMMFAAGKRDREMELIDPDDLKD